MDNTELLQAIKQMFEQSEENHKSELNKQTAEIKEYIKNNNLAIGELFEETTSKLQKEIEEIKPATVQNSYDIATLKSKIG